MKNTMVDRVLRKYAKKSLNRKVDDAFKTWKGKSSLSNQEIGYWTLKSWRNFSKKDVSEDPLKRKKKEYAKRVFKKFEEAVLKDEEKSLESQDGVLEESQVVKLLDKKDYGLPKKFYSKNKLMIKDVNPSEEDVKKLASEIGELFKTPGHQKGLIGSFVRGKKFFLKRNAKMMSQFYKQTSQFLKKEKTDKDLNLQAKIKENLESNPELHRTSKLLAANWTQSTIIPKVGLLLGVGGKLSIGSAVAASVTTAVGGSASVSTMPAWIPLLAGVAVSSIVMGQVFKKTVKKLNEMEGGKRGYETIAADIYAGYATPEKIEKEYKEKMEEILNSKGDPKTKKKKILKLYEKFDKDVRPSIDKGLYLLGESEGAATGDYLKRGAEEDLPVYLQLKHLKESYESEDVILETLKSDSKEVSKQAQKLLSGKEELPKDVMDSMKGFVDAGKKASSQKVARLYLNSLQSLF